MRYVFYVNPIAGKGITQENIIKNTIFRKYNIRFLLYNCIGRVI